MTPPTLHLPHQLETQIRSFAESAYPNECCGILLGAESNSTRHVSSILPAPNAHAPHDQHHRFSIAPSFLHLAERQAAAGGHTVLGFYHSHPDHPARPSEFDRTHAWSFYSYLIVSVSNSRSSDLTSWQFDDASEQFNPQQLIVIDTAVGSTV